ncbi:PREDICTED: uncharacterized protein LOC104487637, partial [Chlamydotis macqueenii]|uniref:uncharacterized protein LOC104487637 n=1 Tax=Chlamydotis macqueenii TaxID=187382 RepID=UPI0005298F81
SEHGEPPGSFVDVRSPLLIQQQFDAEQKRVGMLGERGGDGGTWVETTTLVATPAPRDAAPSCDASLKPPVQEKKLPAAEMASSTPSVPTEEKVLPASAEPLLAVAGSSEGKAGRTASRVSCATSIWAPHSSVEGDAELSKPGVLLSTPHLQERPAHAAREDPREEHAAGASRDSSPPPSWESTSQGTHEVRVDRYPSTQLEAGSDFPDRAVSPGNPQVFDSSRSRGAATSSSQAEVPPGDSNGPSLPYVLPAVGIAVISAVAFLVYARLQK